MKRAIAWCVLLCAVILVMVTGAAAATIVGLSGDVKVRARETASWEAAVKGQEVPKEAGIQCGPAARCTVALDETLQNTVTVKENTTVTVEELEPGRIFLKEGRVFSIIKGVATQGSFQVRTPTSVSGARGTAWLTHFGTGRTEVSVFEDNVFVSGIDAAGNVTDEIDVATGQGVSVAADGLLGEIFVVSVEEINEWREEKQELQALRKELGTPAPPERKEGKKEAKPPAPPLPSGEQDTSGLKAKEEPVSGEPLPGTQPDTTPETGMESDELDGMTDPMLDDSGMTDPMMEDPFMEDPFMEDSMLDPDLGQEIIDERHDSEMADSTNDSSDGSVGTTT